MAVKDEQTTTRARANILREFLTRSPGKNPFNHPEIYAVMDLCLSCKACKSECPSSVDMAKLKAEFLQHWYDANGIPFRSTLITHITRINHWASMAPSAFNFFLRNKWTVQVIMSWLGFSPRRMMPALSHLTLRHWIRKNLPGLNQQLPCKKGSFWLFVDEFTNFHDVDVGITFIRLVHSLSYEVKVIDHEISGRTFLSKGLLRKARKIALRNKHIFSGIVSAEVPLVGLEPSAILSFRDEYPDLVGTGNREASQELAHHVLLYDEFIVREMDAGRITSDQFTQQIMQIKLHGHCHQKALASVENSVKMLSLPVNYQVEEIKSGCCGMAGAFGYEKEHYDISMKVGELILFPEIRKTHSATYIAAPGTSCRHQIADGTGRKAYHPVELLYMALA